MMKQPKRDELLIRMDERIKTIFHTQSDFEELFKNHLHHHELWESDIKQHMRWWMGIIFAMCATAIGFTRLF
jgi:hypothetical protein|tara:strand:- start:1626 stop:1841 length:216 start_codon:yes stop_codon:yes gene_type:complete